MDSEFTIFHICNKGIANFNIFSATSHSERFLWTLDYYRRNSKTKLSVEIRKKRYEYLNLLEYSSSSQVKILAYCIMPDHYHLLLKAPEFNFISQFINNIQNSYTRYFNLKHKRKGPLWQSRFRRVRVESDSQLLHLSRYIHINHTTSKLVMVPEDWQFSSYRDIISSEHYLKNILTEISIRKPNLYKQFVDNQIDYQRKLKAIKRSLLE